MLFFFFLYKLSRKVEGDLNDSQNYKKKGKFIVNVFAFLKKNIFFILCR